jgi:hypothetical protein
LIENNADAKPGVCYCRYQFLSKLQVGKMCSSLLHCDLQGRNEISREWDLVHAGNEMAAPASACKRIHQEALQATAAQVPPYVGPLKGEAQCSAIRFITTRKQIVSLFLLDSRLCGLVIRVPVYRSRGPSSTPGATRFP